MVSPCFIACLTVEADVAVRLAKAVGGDAGVGAGVRLAEVSDPQRHLGAVVRCLLLGNRVLITATGSIS